ncbi:MAG: hypothetical protein ACTHLA_11425 [Asticcacaulis sp.]|uniref:hypothetical protein n=1 Tax=Asticcacaulis sp. TaxID=1872648 RepID=UPI003F7C01AD
MSSDARTDQPHLTPEQRREMLRAFADRMLIKISAMDDPEDLPGVERAVRVASVIERLYSRCDHAEHQGPDPRKLRAERAQNEGEALKAQVSLAGTLRWSEERRRDLGKWWDAAGEAIKTPVAETKTTHTPPVRMAKAADVSKAHDTETRQTAPGRFPTGTGKSPLPPP